MLYIWDNKVASQYRVSFQAVDPTPDILSTTPSSIPSTTLSSTTPLPPNPQSPDTGKST